MFTATGLMVVSRVDHAAALLASGKVLVTGGVDRSASLDGNVVRSAELYDPDANAFTATGSMVSVRDIHTATALPDRKVLVAGGRAEVTVGLGTAELYSY